MLNISFEDIVDMANTLSFDLHVAAMSFNYNGIISRMEVIGIKG